MTSGQRTKQLGDTTEHTTSTYLANERARALVQRDVATVEPTATLGEALERMRATEGECVLVCDDGRLAGILTERDVLMRVLGRNVDAGASVSDVMTPDPGTLGAEATVREAIETMDRGGYRHLPLVDDNGKLVGLLRQQDVVEYVAELFPQEILNLPPRPHQKMEEPEGA